MLRYNYKNGTNSLRMIGSRNLFNQATAMTHSLMRINLHTRHSKLEVFTTRGNAATITSRGRLFTTTSRSSTIDRALKMKRPLLNRKTSKQTLQKDITASKNISELLDLFDFHSITLTSLNRATFAFHLGKIGRETKVRFENLSNDDQMRVHRMVEGCDTALVGMSFKEFFPMLRGFSSFGVPLDDNFSVVCSNMLKSEILTSNNNFDFTFILSEAAKMNSNIWSIVSEAAASRITSSSDSITASLNQLECFSILTAFSKGTSKPQNDIVMDKVLSRLEEIAMLSNSMEMSSELPGYVVGLLSTLTNNSTKKNVPTSKLLLYLSTLIQDNIFKFSARELIVIGWSHVRGQRYDYPLLKKIGVVLSKEENLIGLSPKDLTNACYFIAKAQLDFPDVFKNLAVKFTEKPNGYDPSDVSTILWGFAKSSTTNSASAVRHKGRDALLMDVFTTAEKVMQDNIYSFRPRELSRAIWAFAKVKYQAPALMTRAAEMLCVQFDSYDPEMLAQLLLGFSNTKDFTSVHQDKQQRVALNECLGMVVGDIMTYGDRYADDHVSTIIRSLVKLHFVNYSFLDDVLGRITSNVHELKPIIVANYTTAISSVIASPLHKKTDLDFEVRCNKYFDEVAMVAKQNIGNPSWVKFNVMIDLSSSFKRLNRRLDAEFFVEARYMGCDSVKDVLDIVEEYGVLFESVDYAKCLEILSKAKVIYRNSSFDKASAKDYMLLDSFVNFVPLDVLSKMEASELSIVIKALSSRGRLEKQVGIDFIQAFAKGLGAQADNLPISDIVTSLKFLSSRTTSLPTYFNEMLAKISNSSASLTTSERDSIQLSLEGLLSSVNSSKSESLSVVRHLKHVLSVLKSTDEVGTLNDGVATKKCLSEVELTKVIQSSPSIKTILSELHDFFTFNKIDFASALLLPLVVGRVALLHNQPKAEVIRGIKTPHETADAKHAAVPLDDLWNLCQSCLSSITFEDSISILHGISTIQASSPPYALLDSLGDSITAGLAVMEPGKSDASMAMISSVVEDHCKLGVTNATVFDAALQAMTRVLKSRFSNEVPTQMSTDSGKYLAKLLWDMRTEGYSSIYLNQLLLSSVDPLLKSMSRLRCVDLCQIVICYSEYLRKSTKTEEIEMLLTRASFRILEIRRRPGLLSILPHPFAEAMLSALNHMRDDKGESHFALNETGMKLGREAISIIAGSDFRQSKFSSLIDYLRIFIVCDSDTTKFVIFLPLWEKVSYLIKCAGIRNKSIEIAYDNAVEILRLNQFVQERGMSVNALFIMDSLSSDAIDIISKKCEDLTALSALSPENRVLVIKLLCTMKGKRDLVKRQGLLASLTSSMTDQISFHTAEQIRDVEYCIAQFSTRSPVNDFKGFLYTLQDYNRLKFVPVSDSISSAETAFDSSPTSSPAVTSSSIGVEVSESEVPAKALARESDMARLISLASQLASGQAGDLSTLLHEAVGVLKSVTSGLRVADKVALMHTMASVGSTSSATATALLGAFVTGLENDITSGKLSSEDMVIVMECLTTHNINAPILYNSIAKKLESVIGELTPSDVARTVKSFAVAGLSSPVLLNKAMVTSEDRIELFTSKEMKDVLWGASKLQLYTPTLYAAAANRLSCTLRVFDKDELSTLLWACGSAGLAGRDFVDEIMERLRDVTAAEVFNTRTTPAARYC